MGMDECAAATPPGKRNRISPCRQNAKRFLSEQSLQRLQELKVKLAQNSLHNVEQLNSKKKKKQNWNTHDCPLHSEKAVCQQAFGDQQPKQAPAANLVDLI